MVCLLLSLGFSACPLVPPFVIWFVCLFTLTASVLWLVYFCLLSWVCLVISLFFVSFSAYGYWLVNLLLFLAMSASWLIEEQDITYRLRDMARMMDGQDSTFEQTGLD